jgi:hypothetical protein
MTSMIRPVGTGATPVTGSAPKTVLTDSGEVAVEVPRDATAASSR